MAASITDKFKKYSDGSNVPNPARVASPRSTGGSTLACDDLSGWASDTAVNFITYQLDTANEVVDTTVTYWVGIVSSNSLTNVTRVKGAADGGNSINDVVMQIPDSDRFDDLITGILTHSDQDGTLKAGAVDSSAVLADSVVSTAKLADAAVTNAKLSTSSTEIGGAGESWTPTLTGGGSLSISSVSVVGAEKKKIGKLVFFNAEVTFTAGGTANNTVYVSYPSTKDSNTTANYTVRVINAGGSSTAGFTFHDSTTRFAVRAYDSSNFTTGTNRLISVNGFYWEA